MRAYLIVGSPGVGKTWVMSKLEDQYQVLHHDTYIGRNYVQAIYEAVSKASKPILIETPFSMSQIIDPLDKAGIEVIPVFIIETDEIHLERYKVRGKEMPKGHLARTKTYLERAITGNHYYGTSEQVLKYLRSLK